MGPAHEPDIGLEERLRLTGMGSFEWDLESGALHLDDNCLTVLDLPAEEFRGTAESLRRRIPPEEAVRVTSVVNEAVETGSDSYGVYFQVSLGDGTSRLTHASGHVLRDAEGRAVRVVGILRAAPHEPAELAGLDGVDAKRRRVALMVQGTTEALSRAVTVDDVVAVLSGASGLDRFAADGLVLGLVEGDELKLIALVGQSMQLLDELKLHQIDDSLPLAEVVMHRRPRFVVDLPHLADRFQRLGPYIDRLKLDSAAFLPLVAQDRAIGGLGLFYRGRREFSDADRNLCIGLSGIVAQSLQRAILFDEERDLARSLQATMLPKDIPQVRDTELAVRYHAAWGGRQVGGDFYDVIVLPRGRVGVVVGDVQGHDTHAAAIMGQLRIALRAFAGEGHPPSAVLSRASRFLAELDTERFATCTYAQFDPATGIVRAVRAGHLPPLVRHTDGRVGIPRLRGGLPLGLATEFEQDEFPETRLDLVPGETLVLCTDGLVEEPGSDVDAGMRALATALSEGPHTAEEVADHLSRSLWEKWGSGDDVALLVLRRVPDSGTEQAPRIHRYVHQADPDGLSDARAALREHLTAWGLGGMADDVEVAAGELLVNALMHTEGGAVLTLEVLTGPPRAVRLWVKDRSSARPHRRTPGETATSGRGMLLVEALASRWGVEPRGEGKAVWCDFVVPDA
ncbi:SpoIIE family protein phosphatase [Streptomyces sp. VRA16 Mangrove soil]|uniref:SpoIIE family protein phosphatase n=1 Tax=Streptomyces sp. VRA16 Mangrove soil TaxID=2817434 RepID=UPI001A9EC9E4|nr:SpoIIE family protein phosphatase [Streptomyces sp. VRA16 Mangrove soil]MBO1332838.1 SpoIIE family protein phosphatase [Streptomyces sp. VRA16 Mangrove soil]